MAVKEEQPPGNGKEKGPKWSLHYIRNKSTGEITSVRVVAAKVRGLQIRATFNLRKYGGLEKAEKAAKKWATEKAKAVEQGKHVIRDVPDRLIEEIIECLELLEPYGKRIPDIIREYISRPELQVTPWKVAEAAAAFIASRKISGKRSEYIRSLEDIFNLFGREFGEKLLDEIATEEIEHWLSTRGKKGPLSPVTYRNYRRDLRMLWRFALKRHRCSLDPVTPIAVPSSEEEPVKILKADDVKKLLEHTPQAQQIYPAVMAFAGVRPFEILELSKNSIDECYKYLSISGLHAKSRKRRLVTVSANLAEWVRRGEGLGQIRSYWTLHAMLKKAATDAGIALTQDVLRHSFASHHLAFHRNAALTAHELGHHNQQMLFEHYRELVTHEEATAYFGILPP